ncbi:predicted protein [Uncinocarpus reesii 1704]|uniref:mRNA cap guanine-N(7) methyltransferase n=1 Tax=Uncinocarpus reesii (strain UAMH 1704) TaxID=336963 RepID=C4JWQ4_UNCRE|nr:uncharacterized protein UREG_06996 [Uncinocarpus reesii 1704]EEP82131.1 predicted protein [Uncinocarpus reesii 1704]
MATQYDHIGAEYNAIKALPVGALELAAIRSHIGDVGQLRVLDLACGTGYYSKKLIEWGAREVVGLDISEAMVNEARRQSSGDPRLEFHVADCSKPLESLDLGSFDLVIAIWMFNYVATEEEVFAIWQNIHNSLKPGGRCIGLTPNQDYLVKSFPEGPRFGLSLKGLEPIENGVKFQVTVHALNPFSFESYLLDRKIIETCAAKAGLSLRWMPPVNPNDSRVDYEDFLRLPHFKLFTGVCSV